MSVVEDADDNVAHLKDDVIDLKREIYKSRSLPGHKLVSNKNKPRSEKSASAASADATELLPPLGSTNTLSTLAHGSTLSSPYQLRNQLMGWKLTSVRRRKSVMKAMDAFRNEMKMQYTQKRRDPIREIVESAACRRQKLQLLCYDIDKKITQTVDEVDSMVAFDDEIDEETTAANANNKGDEVCDLDKETQDAEDQLADMSLSSGSSSISYKTSHSTDVFQAATPTPLVLSPSVTTARSSIRCMKTSASDNTFRLPILEEDVLKKIEKHNRTFRNMSPLESSVLTPRGLLNKKNMGGFVDAHYPASYTTLYRATSSSSAILAALTNKTTFLPSQTAPDDASSSSSFSISLSEGADKDKEEGFMFRNDVDCLESPLMGESFFANATTEEDDLPWQNGEQLIGDMDIVDCAVGLPPPKSFFLPFK